MLSKNVYSLKNSNAAGFSGYSRVVVSIESDSSLNLIGHSSRAVSSVEFDKTTNSFLTKKIWSFFSDKIKIFYEKNTDVFFLNSEKNICTTSSRNQAMIRVLSNEIFDQAIMFAVSLSDKFFVLVKCKNSLKILELTKNEIVNSWEIESQPILSDICVRGEFFFAKTYDETLILQFNDAKELPYNMTKTKLSYDAIDVLSLDFDKETFSLNLIGYEISESGICVESINTSDNVVSNSISLKDISLCNTKLGFGKFLCISGKIQFQFYK